MIGVHQNSLRCIYNQKGSLLYFIHGMMLQE